MTNTVEQIARVSEAVIDELRNYKGFRRWWDNWNGQEQIETDIAQAAINKHLELLIEKAEEEARGWTEENGVESNDIFINISACAEIWLREQQNQHT